MQDFFNPYDVIQRHGAALPHWQQGSAYVFATWRLADSLPSNLLRELKSERGIWMSKHPIPWEAVTWEEYNERFPMRMEAWLDRGMGSCLLRQPQLRRVICGALRHFDSDRYTVAAYVVMPNHVHIVFQPQEGCLIEDIMHSWKSYTSKEVHKLTGNCGELWQRGYWDRLIRSQLHFDRCLRYIRENPADAGLVGAHYTWYERGV
ncbi:REP-associated tyrosine transposase [Coraliomargarita sp. W4R53]